MMKSISGYVLGTALSIMLVGCVMEDESSLDLSDSEIVIGEELDQAPLPTQIDEEVAPLASWSEDGSAVEVAHDGDYGTEACWVTLVYCDNPATPESNDFVCRQSGCTFWQYITHCTALVDQTCG